MTSTPASAAPAARTGPERLESLDGLRGLAALAVVVYHVLIVVPPVADVVSGGVAPAAGSAEWWLYRTPLRVLLAGHEAVLIFFVLSGIVLTLPLLDPGRRAPWRSYYVRRLCRLYVPVLASLALAAVVTVTIAPHQKMAGYGLLEHETPPVSRLLRDGVLLFGTSNLNPPLWSLRWEMWFSLLLPLMFAILVAVRVTRWWPAALVILVGASVVARFPATKDALPLSFLSSGLLEYIPVFAIGMIIALHRERLRGWGDRVRASSRAGAVWATLTVAALLLTLSPSFVAAHTKPFGSANAVGYVASLLGVCLLMFATLEGGSRLLRGRVVQWLGSRSFSLYLIHAPLIVAVALVMKADTYFPYLYVAVPMVAGILLVAEGFFRVAERPAHRLSRRLGALALGADRPVPEDRTPSAVAA